MHSKIGIDAHILGKKKGGVEHTVEMLIRALAVTDLQNEYFIYTTAKHPFAPAELPTNFKICILPHSSPWVGRLALLPYFYQRDRLNVLYVQRVAPPFGCPCIVLHVHDAMYATHPHLFSAWKRWVLNGVFRWSGKHAVAVITPTESSSRDIIREYGIHPEKIHVVPDTVETTELYPETDRELLGRTFSKFGLTKPYIVYLGAIERNKNVHCLVDAFRLFLDSCPGYQLALVGGWRSETRGGYAEEIQNQIQRLGLHEFVATTGYVSKEERRLLLGGARMMVFPSEAEGLGLPPLEAMACGTPVIASDLPSLREVYGGALLLSRVNDVANLAERMVELATSPELAAEMIQRGLVRASRDRWDYKGQRMLEVFKGAHAACQSL